MAGTHDNRASGDNNGAKKVSGWFWIVQPGQVVKQPPDSREGRTWNIDYEQSSADHPRC